MFLSLFHHSIANIRGLVNMILCCVYVYIWPEVADLFFSALSALSVANIRGWVLLYGLVLCMWRYLTRSNLSSYSHLLTPLIANISKWVLLNGLVLCIIMWIFDHKTCLSAHCIADIIWWVFMSEHASKAYRGNQLLLEVHMQNS